MYLQLIELLGPEKVSKSESHLYHHSKDESYHSPVEPNVVVFPSSKEDICKMINFANENRIPVVPYGAGSGLEGQAIPVEKGISVSFENMNKIVNLQVEDLIVTVQPGLTRLQLNEQLKRHGLFFPVDPGADASIGGMASTNASGTAAVRYGTMRDQILNMEVVLPDGKVINTGNLAKKSSSGYHLNGLFIGSEGTLGIITEISLKLHGIPESILAARCSFSSVEKCVQAAHAILMAGIPIARIELVDHVSMKKINEYSGTSYPEAPSLFLEFHGNKAGIQEDALLVETIINELGSNDWVAETDSKARAALWKARHDLAYAFRHQHGGLKAGGADVCVPFSKLTELVVLARKLIDQSGLEGGVVGHIGDGNFHTIMLYNPNDLSQIEAIEHVNDEIVKLALSFGGTCTGEHGVGLGKIKYQLQEHGSALDLMNSIKQMIDPNNIMNPGKLLPQKQASF